MTLVPEILQGLRTAGMPDVPLVVGGIIPEDDARALGKMGVAGVYTPKNYELSTIMADIVALIESRRS
jgi:(2R)-ethylmalonyl-CoA mutase